MISKAIIWGFKASGCRMVGNYLLIGGRFIHKDKVVFDFISGLILGILILGFLVFMYMILWIM